MKKRLLYAVATVGILAGLLALFSLSATAQLRTFLVRLPTGGIIRVTVDAPASNRDGSPTPHNPTFFDALPAPNSATSVPNFVIRQFRVPIFLLPIYQAAGNQYGIRWEVLAAINEIESDYGRNLSVSTAGAVGWMQFLPSTWARYGV